MIKKPKLDIIGIDITHRCNLMCKHCFNSSSYDNNKKAELSKDELLELIKEISYYSTKDVCICGGETLLRSTEIIEMVKLFRSLNDKTKNINLVTNGLLLSDKFAKELKEAGMRFVQVSIDGLENTHNWIRGNDRSFEKAINAVKILKDNNFYVAVSTLPTKKSLDDLDELIELLYSIGVKNFRMQPFMELGRGKELDKEFLLNEEDYLKLSRDLRLKYPKKYKKMDIEWGDPIQHLSNMMHSDELAYLSITPYGEIMISPYLPIVFGNVKKYSLGKYIEAGLLEIHKNQFVKSMIELLVENKLNLDNVKKGLPSVFIEKHINLDLMDCEMENYSERLRIKYNL